MTGARLSAAPHRENHFVLRRENGRIARYLGLAARPVPVFGGMGAGAFIAAMVVYFREGDKARSTVFASLVAAVVCLAVGLLLLLSELITPLRGMMMWQSFSNFGSWMTFGAWIVFAALVVFALEAIVVWEKTAGALAKRIKGFDRVCAEAGARVRRRQLRAGLLRGGVHGHSAHERSGCSALEHIAPAVLVHGVGAGYRRGSGGGYRAGQP